jgi:DNA-binding transcriptional regulator GbsR (MarR family)
LKVRALRGENREVTEAERVRDEFVALWGRLGSFWGISPAAARVFGYLVSCDEGAEADTLCADLGMSRGAISMACRELREWGLAWSDKQPGSRRVLWRIESDSEKVVRQIVQTRKRREWDPILENVRAWIAELDGDGDAETFRERLRTVEALVSLVDSMAERFLNGGNVERFGLKLLVGAAERRRRKTKSVARKEQR